MGDLSRFERGQIVDAHLGGASATKTATLLGILERQFVRLCRHARIISEEEQ
jgi:hypothetical protein